MKYILYIVIHCYNEKEVLNVTVQKLLIKINMMIENKTISKHSKILFINDGSKDKTWSIIEELELQKMKYIVGV